MSHNSTKLHVDPSIRDCAHALMLEAMDSINRTCRAGGSFYAARDAALEAAASPWVKAYGKEAADMAVRGLHMLSPAEVLDRDTQHVMVRHETERAMIALRELDPGRDTWINRAFLGLFGLRLYTIAVAVLCAWMALQPASRAFAGDSARVGTRWRALALCGVSKPGPERARACAPFNSVERSTWRGYDAPGGTPRSWELPRSWEVQRSYDR